MPSHTLGSDKSAAGAPARALFGNALADHLAGLAADSAQVPNDQAEQWQAWQARAAAIAARIAAVAMANGNCVKDPLEIDRPPAPPTPSLEALRQGTAHDLHKLGKAAFRCTVCWARSPVGRTPRAWLQTECGRDEAAFHDGPDPTHEAQSLEAEGKHYLGCRRCFLVAGPARLGGLAKPCEQRQSSLANRISFRRLLKGLPPLDKTPRARGLARAVFEDE